MKHSPLQPSGKRMRARRKHPRPGNLAMTKAEAAHVDAVKRAGCVCCIARGYLPDDNAPAVEAHHLKRGNLRIDHLHTVGLCIWHHRGRLFVDGWNHAEHRLLLGASLDDGSGCAAAFRRQFGSDADLLLAQSALLGEPG